MIVTDKCLYFDGASYIELASSDMLDFGQGDFTIDYFVRPLTGSGGAYGNGETTNKLIAPMFDSSTSARVVVGGTNRITGIVFQEDVWQHFTLARKGNSVKAFVDGYQQGSTWDATGISIGGPTKNFIGTSGSGHDFEGYIAEVRITKGEALFWDDGFIPPILPSTIEPSQTGDGEYIGDGEPAVPGGSFPVQEFGESEILSGYADLFSSIDITASGHADASGVITVIIAASSNLPADITIIKPSGYPLPGSMIINKYGYEDLYCTMDVEGLVTPSGTGSIRLTIESPTVMNNPHLETMILTMRDVTNSNNFIWASGNYEVNTCGSYAFDVTINQLPTDRYISIGLDADTLNIHNWSEPFHLGQVVTSDAPTVEEIDDYLATQHGSGSWLGISGGLGCVWSEAQRDTALSDLTQIQDDIAAVPSGVNTLLTSIHGDGSWQTAVVPSGIWSEGEKDTLLADVGIIKTKTDDIPGDVDTWLTSTHGSGSWVDQLGASGWPTKEEIASQVDFELTTQHGSGSWVGISGGGGASPSGVVDLDTYEIDLKLQVL